MVYVWIHNIYIYKQISTLDNPHWSWMSFASHACFTQPNLPTAPLYWSHVLHVAIGTAGQSLPGQDLSGLEEFHGIPWKILGKFGSIQWMGSHGLRTWIAGDATSTKTSFVVKQIWNPSVWVSTMASFKVCMQRSTASWAILSIAAMTFGNIHWILGYLQNTRKSPIKNKGCIYIHIYIYIYMYIIIHTHTYIYIYIYQSNVHALYKVLP